MGRGAAPARGRGFRGGIGRARGRHISDRRRRAALRWCRGGACEGTCRCWICLGSACRRGGTALRRTCGGERGPSRTGSDRRGEGGAGLPGAAPPLTPAASVEQVRRARRARGTSDRRAGVASRRCCRGAGDRRGSGRGASQAGGQNAQPRVRGRSPAAEWQRPSPSPRRSGTS